MGFGTFITDAAGKLNDISKGAFDTFGMKHHGRFDPGFGDLVKGGFKDGVKKILSKAGITGEQLESWGSTGWQETLKQLGGAVGSELAAAGAGAAIGGPLGVAAGIAMETGQVLHNLFEDKQGPFDPHVTYKPGQWIAIDNGLSAVTKHMRNVLDGKWQRRRMVGRGAPDIQEGEGLAMRESLSVGFVLGPGQDKDTITVFNCLKGRDEQKKLGEVRPLDHSHATAMDNNEVWSEIRLLRFETDELESSMLDTDVNTDPGSEVLRDGERFLVVDSHNDQVLIEHKRTGAQHWVVVSELTPGRRTHNNSWNYEHGKVTGGFASGTKASIAQGDWVWVAPESYIADKYASVTRQLACIQELDGHDVRGFMAVDGTAITVADNDNNLRPVSKDLNSYLSSSKVFSGFKDAVVRGHDVNRLAAGRHDEATLLCLGISPLDDYVDTTEDVDWRAEAAQWKTEWRKSHLDLATGVASRRSANLALRGGSAAAQVDDAGDGGLKEQLDLAEEAALFGETKPTELVKDTLEESWSEPPQTEKSNTSTLVMLGLAGAGALFFLR